MASVLFGSEGDETVKKLNAVIYLSPGADQVLLTPSQLQELREFADANGYCVIAEYNADTDFASLLTQRSETSDTLVHDQYDAVIVWNDSSLGSSRQAADYHKYLIYRSGRRLLRLDQSDSPLSMENMLAELMNIVGNAYCQEMKKNIGSWQYQRALRARHIGGKLPYGYRLGRSNEYVININEAYIGNLIFSQFAQYGNPGLVLEQIKAYMMSEHYEKTFTMDELINILTEEKYIGTYSYKNLFRKTESTPALVSRPMYFRALRQYYTFKKEILEQWSYSDTLLDGKLYCGKCGAPMAASTYTPENLEEEENGYCCTSGAAAGCYNITSRTKWLEAYVLNEVLKLFDDEDIIESIAERLWNQYIKTLNAESQLKALASERQNIRNMNESFLYVTGRYNKDSEPIMTRESFSLLFNQVKRLPAEQRSVQHQLIDLFVNSVFIEDDYIYIRFNFSGENSEHFRSRITPYRIMEYVDVFDSHMANLFYE